MTRSYERRTLAAAAFVLTLGVALAATLSGQAARPAATLDDLLAELRGMRSDARQASTDSMRLQALVARVSLQEQRLKALGERLAVAQREVEAAAAERAARQGRLAAMEAADDGPNDETRREVAEMKAALKREIGGLATREERLQAALADVSAQLLTEEGRWADFNQRLDEVDRRLASAPRAR